MNTSRPAARWLVAALLALVPLTAQPTSLPFGQLRAELTEVGVFEALGEGVLRPAPRTALGMMSLFEGFKLLFPATTLEAAKGATFGFRYQILGASDGLIEGLETRAEHPPIQVEGRPLSTESIVETYAFSNGGIAEGIVVYSLDEPSEIRPGRWTLELIRDGRVLVSQVFMLQ